MSESENAPRFKPDIPFWILSLCLIFLFFWLAWPKSYHPRPGRPPAYFCIDNLRQIDAAAEQFALENHLTHGEQINFPNDLTPYIKLDKNNRIPSCPSGGTYSINKVGDKPICSLGTTVTPAHVLP